MPVTKKGVATIEGIPGAFDVIIWLPQTGKVTDNTEEEVIKDQHGNDCAWLARNQHLLNDVSMKVAGVNSGVTTAQLYSQVWPLAPLAIVTLSGFVFATDNEGNGGLNGTYQYMSGADLNLMFDKVNEATFKLRKYVDPAQNALAATVPN